MKSLYKLMVFAGMTSLVLSAASCEKFLEVGTPKTEIGTELVFNSNSAATTAVLGIYGDMNNSTNGIWVKTSSLLGQAADELATIESPPGSNYYTNSLVSTAQNDDFWTPFYKYVYAANNVLENLTPSSAVSPEIKKQLTGEALFIRAYMHFYLVNLYGDVPYITSSDYKVTSVQPRMATDFVYEQIIKDLKEAKLLLTNNFPDPANNIPLPTATERIRPNKGAAGALLARVYLYRKNWHQAELEADTLINNTANYELLTDMNAVFLKNSRETIWALQSSNVSNPNTFDAAKFLLNSAPSAFGKAVSLRPDYYNNAFEAGDKRKSLWTGIFTSGVNSWYYPLKYKEVGTTGAVKEYSIVLRLSEQYLIRAEARARQSNVSGAVTDLNAVRARSRTAVTDLPDYLPTITENDCVDAILRERRVEFFAEGGHRWLDLKRTDKAHTLLEALKGDNWKTEDQLFPIPDSQLDFDPAMKGKQNPGY